MNQNILLIAILLILAGAMISKFFGLPVTPFLLRTPTAHTVTMDAKGFSPAELTIRVGDIVNFRNSDSRNRWPASDIHPTHELCQGFDALKAVPPGESYSHTFSEAKICAFHDHLIPNLRGSITASEE